MNQLLKPNPMDKGSAIAAALLLAAIGASFYNLLPLVVGVAQDSRGWSDAHVGFLGTAFYAGFNIVTISAFFWLRSVSWKTICGASVPIAAAGMLGAIYLDGYTATLVEFAIGGGAFGALYCVATVAIGDTTNEESWFGAKIGSETLLAGILLLGLPALVIAPYGFSGLLVVLAAQAVLAAVFIPFIPRFGAYAGPVGEAKDEDTIPQVGNRAIWLALFVTLFFFTGQTAIWAFLERVGNGAGFGAEQLGLVLTLALFSAMAGALIEAVSIRKLGLNAVLIVACIAVLAGTILFARADGIVAFGIGACLFMFGVGAAVPSTIAAVSSLDVSGRFTTLTVPALGIGAMIGPGLAGQVSSMAGKSGFEVLALLTAVGTVGLNFVAKKHASVLKADCV